RRARGRGRDRRSGRGTRHHDGRDRGGPGTPLLHRAERRRGAPPRRPARAAAPRGRDRRRVPAAPRRSDRRPLEGGAPGMSRLRINPSLPVVVLGFGYGGLGIARSLGRLGVRVYAVDADPAAAGFASRYLRGAHTWDVAGASVTDTLGFLDDLGRRLGHALLLPTTDATAVLVAEHSDELAPRFLFPRPPRALVRGLTDQREVFRLATRFGVPTPLTVFPRSRDDVERFLADARFPVVVSELRTDRRAIVATPEALLSRYLEWEDRTAPNLMLQEHIPGGDDAVWMFNGVFNEWSECVAAFTGRKLRQHPVYGGTTSLGVCERNERVERLTIDFMWALGYQGVLDVGYRYDARDGQYKLLDPNPRVGSTFRLFVDEQGLDVVRVPYC